MIVQFPRQSGTSPDGAATSSALYEPLDRVTRPMLTTAEAAYYLNRRPQTLRVWACTEEGPIRPVRLHGRLGWPLSEVCRCLGVSHAMGHDELCR